CTHLNSAGRVTRAFVIMTTRSRRSMRSIKRARRNGRSRV
ncbi:MAG: hypothetical protein AVDCRST_MAG77-2365, partial [uncultured Chloroflexi bacterium]